MKIIYFANHHNQSPTDATEEHISKALVELGHEVLRVHEFTPDKVPAEGYDLLLFHKGGRYLLPVLEKVKYKKVGWYFDKVWNERPFWMKQVLPRVDLMFMTDETWAKKSGFKNIKILRQGIGDYDGYIGKSRPEKYSVKIAFTGGLYHERHKWADWLEKCFPGQFGVFSGVFNRDLFDFCATVPILVAPRYPSDDYYWSSRIYITIGSGGFLIHPKLKGIEAEYESGVHYVGYENDDELISKIVFYLEHSEEREKIRKAGFDKTHKDFTYKKRIETLISEIAE